MLAWARPDAAAAVGRDRVARSAVSDPRPRPQGQKNLRALAHGGRTRHAGGAHRDRRACSAAIVGRVHGSGADGTTQCARRSTRASRSIPRASSTSRPTSRVALRAADHRRPRALPARIRSARGSALGVSSRPERCTRGPTSRRCSARSAASTAGAAPVKRRSTLGGLCSSRRSASPAARVRSPMEPPRPTRRRPTRCRRRRQRRRRPRPPPRPLSPLPPDGRAAPPTEAATRGTSKVRAGLEVFAEYMYRRTLGQGDSTAWFHAFDRPPRPRRDRRRARRTDPRSPPRRGGALGVRGLSRRRRRRQPRHPRARGLRRVQAGGAARDLGGRRPDAHRSRARRHVDDARDRALRSRSQRAGASPANLGVKVRIEAPEHYGWAALAAYQRRGLHEPRAQSRQDPRGRARGPSAARRARSFRSGVFFSYTAGSTGTASARADRLTSRASYGRARAARAGAFFTYAWGVAQRRDAARGRSARAFVRVEPVTRLLVGARADVAVRDVRTGPADAISTLWLTAGYRIADPLEVFVAGSRSTRHQPRRCRAPRLRRLGASRHRARRLLSNVLSRGAVMRRRIIVVVTAFVFVSVGLRSSRSRARSRRTEPYRRARRASRRERRLRRRKAAPARPTARWLRTCRSSRSRRCSSTRSPRRRSGSSSSARARRATDVSGLSRRRFGEGRRRTEADRRRDVSGRHRSSRRSRISSCRVAGSTAAVSPVRTEVRATASTPSSA